MLALSAGVAVLAITTFALFDDRFAQIAVTVLLAVILVLGARVAMPPEAHRMRTARYAVWIFGGVLTLIAGARTYADVLVVAALDYFAPALARKVAGNPLVPSGALVLLATVVMFVAVLLFLRKSAPLGAIMRDPLIRQPNYRDRRAAFVSVLKSHLERVDEDLRWHHRDFVALRAEVDIRNVDRARRRVADLVEAIKQNRDADIFLVVGVPGAGKSVALRKCCMDLLTTQRATERIPIYVNLKEWTTSRSWTAEAPPTDAEFAAFVRGNIRERLPDRARAFFDEHFNRLVDAGEIFFFLDSFDEIPGILDADETSRLLDGVSAVIVRFLRGHTNSRGVIASRYYRRPHLGQGTYVQLDVRPFSERQIAEAVSQSASRPDALKRLIFEERPQLGALARNPFTLSLILLYWERQVEPPPNQSALFSAYIDRSLADAHEELGRMGLDAAILRQAMADISWAMFESDRRGLEMTVHELREVLARNDVDTIVDALVAARLARKAPRTQAVSFVHRRFNEYFLVARWLSGERAAPFDAVPEDSRYRDALVLYAEVASDGEAQRLAAFCWNQINATSGLVDSAALLRATHALRFLIEAFRVRVDALAAFRGPLSIRVLRIMDSNDDILIRKIAVEAVGLLYSTDAESVMLKAISSGNSWIAETAFGACRYLHTMSQSVEDALFLSLAMREQSWILLPDRDFNFRLGVADVFRNLRNRFYAFRIELWLSLSAGVGCILILEWSQRWLGFSLLSLLGIIIAVGLLIQTDLVTRRLPRSMAWDVSALRFEPAILRFTSQNIGIWECLIAAVRLVPLAALISFILVELNINDFVTPIALPSWVPSRARLGLGVEPWKSNTVWTAWAAASSVAAIPYATIAIFLVLGRTTRVHLRTIAFKIALVVLFIGSVFASIAFLWAYVASILPWLASIGFVGISWIAVSAGVRSLVKWLRDRRRLSSALTRFNPSRTIIAATFEGFESDAARLRYVRWVERQAQEPESLARLADIQLNPWPQGRRPNTGESNASVLLAQLDGRWIGLEA